MSLISTASPAAGSAAQASDGYVPAPTVIPLSATLAPTTLAAAAQGSLSSSAQSVPVTPLVSSATTPVSSPSNAPSFTSTTSPSGYVVTNTTTNVYATPTSTSIFSPFWPYEGSATGTDTASPASASASSIYGAAPVTAPWAMPPRQCPYGYMATASPSPNAGPGMPKESAAAAIASYIRNDDMSPVVGRDSRSTSTTVPVVAAANNLQGLAAGQLALLVAACMMVTGGYLL